MSIYTFDLETKIMREIDQMGRSAKFQPIFIGGVSGPNGGTSTGPITIIGQIPQKKVAFDTTEATTSGTAPSGSLLHNLNRIRGGWSMGDGFLKARHLSPEITFTVLPDTPDSYSGQKYKVVRVNSAETALEFAIASGGGANQFIQLADVPNSYASQKLKVPRVKFDETGLEFATISGGGGTGTPGGSDTQVQFNDGGLFGGDSGFTFDKTNNSAYIAGNSAIGNQASINASQGLVVYHNFSSGGNVIGLNASVAVNAAATTSTALSVGSNTLSGSFTLDTARGILINNPAVGASSTITNVFGLLIDNITSGSVLNFAIYTGSGKVFLGDTTDSTSSSTGSLVVSGGMGIAKALNVGTIMGVGANRELGSRINIGGTISGVSSVTLYGIETGTLTLTPSNGDSIIGIESSVTIATSSPNTHNAYAYYAGLNKTGTGTVTIAYGLYISDINIGSTNYAIYSNAGLVRIGDTTDSTSSSTGSIITAGGLGIAKALTVGTTAGVGIAPQAHNALYVTFTDSNSGANLNGGFIVPTVNNTTNNARGVYGRVDTTATSFTLTASQSLYAANPTKGSGSTITTAYGLYVEAMTSGSTNYAIYTAGAGLVSIGDTTDSTSSSTGSIITLGGVGIAKALNVSTVAGIGIASSSTIGAAISNGTVAIQGRVNDSGTSSTPNVIQLTHETSGTPAAGFGIAMQFYAETTTTVDTSLGTDFVSWVDATHASRKARRIFQINDTAAREAMRYEASGSAPMIGFLGAASVARQTIGAAAPAGGTGATAGAYDTAAHRDSMITLLNNIRTALINLGLCQN